MGAPESAQKESADLAKAVRDKEDLEFMRWRTFPTRFGALKIHRGGAGSATEDGGRTIRTGAGESQVPQVRDHFDQAGQVDEQGSPPNLVRRTFASRLRPVRGAGSILAEEQAELVKARAEYRSGHSQDAVTAYKAIIAGRPNSANAYAGLSRALLRREQISEALDAAKKAVDVDAKCPDAHVALGEVYFRKGLMRDSELEYVEALKLDISTARAFMGRARLFQAYSFYKKAHDFIVRAHDLDSFDPDIRKLWLLTLSPSERLEELEKYLDKPRDEDPDEHRNLQSYLSLLKEKQAQQGKTCKLARPVEKTKIPLQMLLDGPNRLTGLGVKIEVNGQRAVLQLDTGASGILISPKMAEKANIQSVRQTRLMGVGDKGTMTGFMGYADSIKIGDLEFQNCMVEVSDRQSPIETQGLIGTDVFAKYLVAVDMPALKIELSPLPKRPGSPGEKPKAVETDIVETDSITNDSAPLDRYVDPSMKDYDTVFRFGHMLLLPTSIGNTTPKLFLIDTGAATTLISPDAAREVTKVNHDSDVIVKGVSGKVKNVYRADKAELRFSHFKQQNEDILAFDLSGMSRHVGTEISGTLGFTVLHMMKMTIDYRDGLVNFEYSGR